MKKLLKQGRRDKQKGAQLTAKGNPKGITLIALVVTIVVLLILAGITINLLFAEGGILKKADEANKVHKEAMNSDWEAINDITDKINGLVDGTGNTGGGETGEGGTGESSGGSEGGNTGGGAGGGDSEGGSSTDSPNESWKELTADERATKLQEEKPVTYLFYDGDESTKTTNSNGTESHSYSLENHFNTIGYFKLIETEATCECRHAREIFEKAKEMGLVTIYDQIENIEETTTDVNGNEVTIGRTFLTAPITEPCMVYYNFECNNQDQKPGGSIPMPYSLNYEISFDGGKTWIDGSKPSFDKTSGDYATALTWLKEDYVRLGYTMVRVRPAMYRNYSLAMMQQPYTLNIQVLTQRNFLKAAKELNFDLSSYNCIHPKK